MAINITSKFSVNLSEVVQNSISAVKAIRNRERMQKEAEFQKAIANGLSYDEQLLMRKKQMEDEKKSGFSDPEYILSLEKSISDTNKLNRFNKYRTKYTQSLAEMSAGKINEEQYVSVLNSQLEGVDDPELRLEIQGNIAEGEAKLKTYNNTILSNQIKKAKYDGTKTTLQDAISKVSAARASALVNKEEDEVTAYDETMSALNSQLSVVTIEDSITDFQVNSSTKGVDPLEKLNFIKSEIAKADPNIVIKVGDKSYTSAQQFWSLERDSFLDGSSKIFGDFFKDLEADTKNKINERVSKFGYPTADVLDATVSTFNNLRTKPEMAPFLNKIDITQATLMTDATEKLAKKIMEVGEFNTEFKEADTELKNIQKKYNVDTTGYQIQMAERLANLVRGNVIPKDEALKTAPEISIKLPSVSAQETPVPSVGKRTSAAPKVGDVIPGTNLKYESADISNLGTPEAPVPGAAPKVGDVIPGTNLKYEQADIENLKVETAPVVPQEGDTRENAQGQKEVFTPEGLWNPVSTTVVSAPTQPVAPTTPTTEPVKAYSGSSIVDYLGSIKQDNSFATRSKLAVEKGIANYTGTAEQNTELLKALRGF